MFDPSTPRTARSRRVVRLILTMTAVAVAASGGATAAAYAQASSSLSPARFAAFDSVYSALVVFEEAPTSESAALARRACNALDRGDRLQAVARRVCLSSLKAVPAAEAFAECETPRSCRLAARRLRMVFTDTLVHSRRSNRIVAAEVAPGPCRTELTAGRALLRTMEKLRDALRLLERGLATGRTATVDRAGARIIDAGQELAQQPSTRQAQATFRQVCAPPG